MLFSHQPFRCTRADVAQTIMNTSLFQVDKSGNLHVSPQFWIYVLITVPLTAATFVYWRWQLRKRMRKHQSMSDC